LELRTKSTALIAAQRTIWNLTQITQTQHTTPTLNTDKSRSVSSREFNWLSMWWSKQQPKTCFFGFVFVYFRGFHACTTEHNLKIISSSSAHGKSGEGFEYVQFKTQFFSTFSEMVAMSLAMQHFCLKIMEF
jgi:hypothetical protein